MSKKIYGSGLIKGLMVTGKRFFGKKVTELYPEVYPNLPERSHGSFDFVADKCISCNLCADACPSGVIRVEAHKDENGKKVLDNYKMNLAYCMFCGLCVEACPKDAINFKPQFEEACYDRDGRYYIYKGNAGQNSENEQKTSETEVQ